MAVTPSWSLPRGREKIAFQQLLDQAVADGGLGGEPPAPVDGTMVYRGKYADDDYIPGDVVTAGGKLYYCKQANSPTPSGIIGVYSGKVADATKLYLPAGAAAGDLAVVMVGAYGGLGGAITGGIALSNTNDSSGGTTAVRASSKVLVQGDIDSPNTPGAGNQFYVCWVFRNTLGVDTGNIRTNRNGLTSVAGALTGPAYICMLAAATVNNGTNGVITPPGMLTQQAQQQGDQSVYHGTMAAGLDTITDTTAIARTFTGSNTVNTVVMAVPVLSAATPPAGSWDPML